MSFAVDGGRLAREMAPMKITLKLFGSLREAAGESTLQVELEDGARVADLREWLAGSNPIVNSLGDRLAASVNLEIAASDALLHDGDEVAFLPPVAGGDGSRPSTTLDAVQACTISSEVLEGDGTLVVDNISISAIPEPSSSLLALLGTGLLVFRRRR